MARVDPQTARLLEKIDLLERANQCQLDTLERYRRKNAALQRENAALKSVVDQAGIKAPQRANIEREGHQE